MLFGSSLDRFIADKGMHTNLQIPTAGTTPASTYSLIPLAYDAIPRRGDDNTKMNNTKTEVSLAQSYELKAYGNDVLREVLPDHIHSICHRRIS